jgi:hypothetical protein
LWAIEPQRLRELVGHALKALGSRIQACLECVPCRLGAASSNISSGASRLLANPGRFVCYGPSPAGRLVGSFVMVLGIVASSHVHPL